MTVKVRNLTFAYAPDAAPVLQDVSFTVQSGELVLLTGPSGGGKSTLLNCLNGVLTGQGLVELSGNNIAGWTVEALACQAGTVFQDPDSQIIQLMVEDELAFGLENLGWPEEAVRRTLAELAPLLELPLTANTVTLSGGQKQRLTIGAALAMNPVILLLDEPFAHVDAAGAGRLIRFLQALARQGKTVLIAEHRLELLVPVIDRLIWLEDGRIAENSTDAGRMGDLLREQRRKVVCRPAALAGEPELLLDFEDLVFGYGESRPVLAGLSLQLPAGGMAVIEGLNGAGKSTLLQICAGRLKPGPRTKKALLANANLAAATKNFLRANIAYVCQNPNHQLFMDTVYHELSVGCSSCQQVAEYLDLFGLTALQHKHPLTLSQGQKRLLALAAAIMHKPKLLLLDEPTVGQDYQNLQRLLRILHYLNGTCKMAMITVTHDPIAAASLGGRYALAGGRLSEIEAADPELRCTGHPLVIQ